MLITVFRCNHYNNFDARWQNISKRAIHHEQRCCSPLSEKGGGGGETPAMEKHPIQD